MRIENKFRQALTLPNGQTIQPGRYISIKVSRWNDLLLDKDVRKLVEFGYLLAVAENDGPTPGNDPLNASDVVFVGNRFASLEELGSRLPVKPSGSSVSKELGEWLGGIIGQQPLLTAARCGEIPPLSLRRTTPGQTLALPSPYAAISGEMVHPSVIYIPQGWKGFNRWMAVTPYPGANDDYENPSILVSNDGINWQVPPGGSNPVVSQPSNVASGAFNSDNHLILSPDGSKLLLLYRFFETGTERLNLMESSDGVTWSVPRTIYSSAPATRRLLSPSMWWDGSQYVIVAHDIVPAGYQPVRMVNGGSDPYTGWPAAPTNITITHPGALAWWHSFFTRLPDGRVTGVIQDGGSGGGKLYLAESADNGVTWSVALLAATSSSYRSCFTIIPEAAGLYGELYWGRLLNSLFTVDRAVVSFDRQSNAVASVSRRGAILHGAMNGITPALADTFRRADNAAAIGAAMSGNTYTVDAGTFGISSNRAYVTTTGNNRAMVDLGAGGENVVLFGRYDTIGTQGYFIFRGADASNYWRIGYNNGSLVMQKVVGGATPILRTIAPAAAVPTGALFEVRAIGSQITIFVDGECILVEPDTPTASQTKVGLQASGAAATYFAEIIASKVS